MIVNYFPYLRNTAVCLFPPIGAVQYFFQNKIYTSTGTTQRDGMGRQEGGGFRMGNTCIPVADSF